MGSSPADPDADAEATAARKAALRDALRAARRALSRDVRRAASERIAGHVAAIVRARGARVVAVYARAGSEVDLAPLVARLADDTTIAWPRVDRARGDLTFHTCPAAALAPGALGILEPPPDAPRVAHLDVVVAPGLGFDGAGRRLGQGGGYYDRTLPALRAAGPLLVVGVAFAAQIVEALPDAPHDARVDVVVTEDGPLDLLDLLDPLDPDVPG